MKTGTDAMSFMPILYVIARKTAGPLALGRKNEYDNPRRHVSDDCGRLKVYLER